MNIIYKVRTQIANLFGDTACKFFWRDFTKAGDLFESLEDLARP